MSDTVSSMIQLLTGSEIQLAAIDTDVVSLLGLTRSGVVARLQLEQEIIDRLDVVIADAHRGVVAAVQREVDAMTGVLRTERARLVGVLDGRTDGVGNIEYQDGRGRSRTLVEEGGPRRVEAVEQRSLDLCRGHDKDDYKVSLNADGEYVRDPNGSTKSGDLVIVEGSSGVQKELKKRGGMRALASRVAANKSLVGEAVDVVPDDILKDLRDRSGGGFQIDDAGYPAVAVTTISKGTLAQMTPPPGGGPVFLGRMLGNDSCPLSDCWFLGSTNENGDMWILDAEGHWVRIDDEGRFRDLLAVPPEWNGDRRIAKAELDDSSEIVCAVGAVAKVVCPKVTNPEGSGEYRPERDFDGGGMQIRITRRHRVPIRHVELSNQLFPNREKL